jgi:hypothetical protein
VRSRYTELAVVGLLAIRTQDGSVCRYVCRWRTVHVGAPVLKCERTCRCCFMSVAKTSSIIVCEGWSAEAHGGHRRGIKRGTNATDGGPLDTRQHVQKSCIARIASDLAERGSLGGRERREGVQLRAIDTRV